MGQKIEYDFRFKKDSISCMLTNFSALFWLSNLLLFSLIKCVCDFPWKTFHLRCFIFKPCVTHFNDNIQRLTLLWKDFRKEWMNSLNNHLSHAFKKHDLRPNFTFFHLMVRHPIHTRKKSSIEKHHWWGSSIGIFRFGKKFHYWCFRVLKFPDQLFYRTFSDGCLWWR